ncbi:RagB/SusD family nutrient uptake outer membrane protein [uncultured Chitinophaga sp.]|uniref:RagB/SusD family nutrient uptake outer membrane protein n=1 Tax=uncultured Chitinophaga sp. TaxID=339340 RepID=UPI0025F16ACC|nr:RagB/SusD family nutrient uptake outer membrane protein [uncultured Chitinophaga sp.]
MKKLILIVLGVCGLASCKKFLSEYSQSDVKPKTTAHYGEILQSDGYPGRLETLQAWAIFLDDDVESYSGPTLAGSGLERQPSSIYQWQPNMSTRAPADGFGASFNTWANYYELLLGANVVLQFIDDAEGPREEKDRLKGQALTLRAFYHFMLVNFYARPYNDSTTTPDKIPGIPIRTSANLSEALLTRNSVKEVYDQIGKDLDTAVLLLDKYKIVEKKTVISHVAAHLLASRVALYTENWEKAIFHADKVLAASPQLMDLNTWGGFPNPEEKPLVGPSNVESIWCYGSYLEKTISPFAEAYDISHSLANTFDPTDLRSLTGFYVNPPEFKFLFAPDFTQQKDLPSYVTSKMDYLNSWRSSEAYLNRAEAYIQLYKKNGDANAAAQALKSLNTLRANRIERSAYQDWTMMPADQLLQQCREERRRELYLEEMHRWFDLRRYGMPAITHVYRPDELTTLQYVLEKRDLQYVIPIPQEVMERNPRLTQIPQLTGERSPK